MSYSLDLLEYTGVLDDTHAEQLLRSPVLVQNIVGVLPELLHVGADQHLPKFNEVTVVFVVHLDNTPGVCTAAHLTTIRSGDLLVRTDNGEGYLAGNFLRLRNRLVVLILVSRCLEDVNVMVGDVGENLYDTISIIAMQMRRIHTLALNSATSSSVRVSAFAIIGIRLTFVWS